MDVNNYNLTESQCDDYGINNKFGNSYSEVENQCRDIELRLLRKFKLKANATVLWLWFCIIMTVLYFAYIAYRIIVFQSVNFYGWRRVSYYIGFIWSIYAYQTAIFSRDLRIYNLDIQETIHNANLDGKNCITAYDYVGKYKGVRDVIKVARKFKE